MPISPADDRQDKGELSDLDAKIEADQELHKLGFGYLHVEQVRGADKAMDEAGDQRHDKIFNPHETLPGTRMSFIGARSDKRRQNIIAYLAALSADASPTPTR